jgi:hypothetical protein
LRDGRVRIKYARDGESGFLQAAGHVCTHAPDPDEANFCDINLKSSCEAKMEQAGKNANWKFFNHGLNTDETRILNKRAKSSYCQ